MILRLREQKGYTRSVDIAAGLAVSKPSVSVAMKQLREGGYITMDRDNYISLTDSGREIAQRIYDRHKLLTHILMKIGVDEATAEQDACKVEHDVRALERRNERIGVGNVAVYFFTFDAVKNRRVFADEDAHACAARFEPL